MDLIHAYYFYSKQINDPDITLNMDVNTSSGNYALNKLIVQNIIHHKTATLSIQASRQFHHPLFCVSIGLIQVRSIIDHTELTPGFVLIRQSHDCKPDLKLQEILGIPKVGRNATLGKVRYSSQFFYMKKMFWLNDHHVLFSVFYC